MGRNEGTNPNVMEIDTKSVYQKAHARLKKEEKHAFSKFTRSRDSRLTLSQYWEGEKIKNGAIKKKTH